MTKKYIGFLKEHRIIVFISIVFSLAYPLTMRITRIFASFEYAELLGRIALSFLLQLLQ